MSERTERAAAKAKQDAEAIPHPTPAPALAIQGPRRRLAIGDPQAPLERFLRILDSHGALGEDGRLAPEVQLVSMGDHFDWGKPPDRERATREGTELLSWLAAHPPEQVTILAGNHDLSRVCELAFFADDAAFQRARAEADALYQRDGEPTEAEERAFLSKYPYVSSIEALARDLSTFAVAQRKRVCALLESRRLRLAHAAAPELLLVHGAVTTDDLQRLGVPPGSMADAGAIARALNGFLDRVVQAWDGREPLDLEPVHRHQTPAGDGRGVLYQRPAHPEESDAEELQGPPRRRYDPRTLPRGLTQVVGHIRDNKARHLLGEWVEDPAPDAEGALRMLRTDGQTVRYRVGTQPRGSEEAAVLFVDGGMNWSDPDRYQLLDLDTRAAAARR